MSVPEELSRSNAAVSIATWYGCGAAEAYRHAGQHDWILDCCLGTLIVTVFPLASWAYLGWIEAVVDELLPYRAEKYRRAIRAITLVLQGAVAALVTRQWLA